MPFIFEWAKDSPKRDLPGRDMRSRIGSIDEYPILQKEIVLLRR
jgi:hypothetical protein